MKSTSEGSKHDGKVKVVPYQPVISEEEAKNSVSERCLPDGNMNTNNASVDLDDEDGGGGGGRGTEEGDCGHEGEVESRAPDGGWGWLVVLGSFITTMVLPLLGPGFGVIFSRYLLGEGSSSTMTAWIFNTQCFIWNMMGIVVRPLASEFGWRNVAVAGGLLAFVAVILSAFTPSPQFLFFSFSLLAGAGGGVVVCMSFIIVPMYFHRRRGLANAIMMSGVCTGQIIGPPLIRLLQDEYGFKGATLVLSAIILNGCVGAAFFHPVEWHLKPRKAINQLKQKGSAPLISKRVTPEEEKGILCTRREDDRGSKEEAVWVSSESLATAGREASQINHFTQPMQPDGVTELRTSSEPNITSAGPSEGARGDKGKGGLMKVLRSTLRDLAILHSPRALIISLGCMFFINGYYNFIMMVPFAMQAADHSLEDAAWCISASAICHMGGRTLISALSDCHWFNMRVAYMSGLATTATTILMFPLVGEVWLLLVVMAGWGLGIGTTMGLYNLIMVRFMGVNNLAPVFGASSLAVALGFLSVGPLVGMIRDASGSYATSMWFLSGLVYVSFVLWLFMPAAQAYDRRRKACQLEQEQERLASDA